MMCKICKVYYMCDEKAKALMSCMNMEIVYVIMIIFAYKYIKSCIHIFMFLCKYVILILYKHNELYEPVG